MSELRWIELEPHREENSVQTSPATWNLKELTARLGEPGQAYDRSVEKLILEGEPARISLADLLLRGSVTIRGEGAATQKDIEVGETLELSVHSGDSISVRPSLLGSDLGMRAELQYNRNGFYGDADLGDTRGYTEDTIRLNAEKAREREQTFREAMEQAATDSGKAGFELTPESEGRTELTFILSGEGERLAETFFAVETREQAGRLAVTVSSHGERAFQATVRGGEDTGYPFLVRSDEYGTLVIHIADPVIAEETAAYEAERKEAEQAEIPEPEGAGPVPAEAEEASGDGAEAAAEEPPGEAAGEASESAGSEPEEGMPEEAPVLVVGKPARWSARSSNGRIASARIRSAGDGIDVSLETGTGGDADITLSCAEAGLAYVFSVRSENGALRLTGSRSEAYKPPEPMPEQETDALLTGLADAILTME